MASGKHVFPLFLDAAAVSTAAAGALAVTTSYHIVTPGSGDVSYTVAAGTIPGQMMVIINAHASNDANITFASPFNAAADVIGLDNGGEQVTAMWNGSAWVILSGEMATSVA
tara:strand:+ start:256 stop:591 length:336 start_codon:yes stop_codon:yes gene_type:complete